MMHILFASALSYAKWHDFCLVLFELDFFVN
jgi:hypothetical protein